LRGRARRRPYRRAAGASGQDLIYYDGPSSLREIQPVIAKLLDQIGYNPRKNLAYMIEVGDVTLVDKYRPRDHQRTVVSSVWDRVLASARRVGSGCPVLGPWDDFEWGMLNGTMAALRRVLGEDWDSTLGT
jgi:hypothetical protein